MLTWFRALNYACLKDVEANLTPLHVFIGPNDSGKSTLLRAIREYMADPEADSQHLMGRLRSANARGGTLVRFDPDSLRAPSGLLPEGNQIGFLDERGQGLPGIYDAILSRGDDAFAKIASEVMRLFPSVKVLRMRAVSQSQKTLETELLDGTRIPSALFSEGLLYYLAFAALPYASPVPVLLVEEPENGLHPARIAEVVRMLREITKGDKTQIIMTTHSPLVVNELEPNEVTLVTRTPKEGTKLTPMANTRNFAERSKVYALGELWLSFANGVDDVPNPGFVLGPRSLHPKV